MLGEGAGEVDPGVDVVEDAGVAGGDDGVFGAARDELAVGIPFTVSTQKGPTRFSLADVRLRFGGSPRIVISTHSHPDGGLGAFRMLAGVTDDDDLERLLMAHSPKLQAILQSARKRIAAGKGIPSTQFWQELEEEQASPGPRRKRRKPA